MLVGEMTIKFPPVCTEHTSLEKVYGLLADSQDRLVVVIDGEAHRVPIGIITERSICEQIIGRRRDPRGLSSANVLDCDIVKADLETDVVQLTGRPATHKPVVVIDSDRRFVGIWDHTAPHTANGRLTTPEFVPSNPGVSPAAHPIMGLA